MLLSSHRLKLKGGGLDKAMVRGLVPEKPSPESGVWIERRSG